MAKRTNHPNASNWEKLSTRDVKDTLQNRDVFEEQQLGRSKIDPIRTKTSRVVVATIAGIMVAFMVWIVGSVIGMLLSMVSINGGASAGQYFKAQVAEGTTAKICYQILDPAGEPLEGAPCFETEEEAIANPPSWWVDAKVEAENASVSVESPDLFSALLVPDLWKIALSLFAGLLTFGIMYPVLMRNLDAQNLMNDTTDINQYTGDQHIALPDEIMRKFDWFPDVGAHSDVQVSSMISHVMLTNKGLKKVDQSIRAEKDLLDEDGDIEYLKGEILRDDQGRALTKKVPIIDEAFGDALFDASGMPADKTLRKKYDTTQVPYNADGSDRDKLGKFKNVADLINADWTFPEYETQRPGGAYIVDTAPVNTMVLAITRAGKGQTYIEPVIDMWLRERRPNNMVINDPKGELLVKNYVRATMRGFQVVQFNLINAMKTDIYNPLGMAADAAREGDTTKCALYVENIADVFFPMDGSEDPVWPNAANNAFKRAAYGLIDYYLEEERQLRATAARTNMDPKILTTRLDEMWGKVTLYNCYQLFVQLSAKKQKSPLKLLDIEVKQGKFGDPQGDEDEFDEYEYRKALEAAERKAFLWQGGDELDLLTLYFNATAALPENSMRKLVSNADMALRAMGAAEKMLASVYGIAITAMSFFSDPTISTLTSGTPAQNVDLGGLSFPRRMGVRFGANYVKRDHLIGAQVRWDAYEDASFTKNLGSDFEHEDIISREGWARYYFKGKFENDVAYIRLRVMNAQTGMLLRTFYFRFTKEYQTSLNGRYFITDPITNEKVVKNGVLVELKQRQRYVRDEKGQQILDPETGKPVTETVFVPGHTTYKQTQLENLTEGEPVKAVAEVPAIISEMVRYSDKPKVVFLVTPPHLMKYAKLILILVKQLVDLNFDKSYMTKSNQKPLYKTRFMLDELGNLQSEGHGIAGFETMLSIGLGQEQQFTIILQTLQQLRDVYGESVDKIVQGNTSNIVFLKSTDDSMLDTLQKMSGTTHRVYRDSKSVTKDTERLLKGFNVEGKVTYTSTTREEPVISYNDLAFISERNSVVFRAGDSPVWNRNETILPMSWRLFQNTLVHPGHDYSLQTIPTLSSALDFDVRLNQPDFSEMLLKRMLQAERTADCRDLYRESFGYEDIDIARLDPDVYSDELMALVDASMRESAADHLGVDADEVDTDDLPSEFFEAMGIEADFEANLEQQEAIRDLAARDAQYIQRVYADQQISREMLVDKAGRGLQGPLDREIAEAYKAARAYMHRDTAYFRTGSGDSLYSADGQLLYIRRIDESESLRELDRAAQGQSERVFADDNEALSEVADLGSYEVTPAFYEFLASLDSWSVFAGREFERAMSRIMANK